MTTNDETGEAVPEATGTNVVPLPAKATEPPHKRVAGFVHDHPVMTIAGGLAVGALAAAFIPKRNRKFIARRSSLVAQAVTAAATALAQQAISQAATATAAARDQAESLVDRAGSIGESSLTKAQSLFGHAAEEPSLREKIASKAGQIRGKLER